MTNQTKYNSAKIGTYKNIVDLINSNPDLLAEWANGDDRTIEEYMSEYWDLDNIEMRILSELNIDLDTIEIKNNSTSRDEWEKVEIVVKSNIKEKVVSSLNEQIQTVNNGKTNITSNPDILNSLGIEDDVEDPEFLEFNEKIDALKVAIEERATEKEENLKTLTANVDRGVYWENFYTLDVYNTMKDKFFSKEYLTHPKARFEKIKTFLEQIVHKFEPYLKEISYKVKSEEDMEAFEKEYLAKSLLIEFYPVIKKVEIKTEKVDLKESSKNISSESKSKLSDFLRKVEAGESLEKEKETSDLKELSEYDKADLKGKISLKYTEVYKRAIELDGEEDGLIKTYVETLYNPETTTLDDKNLLLNLLIVSRMQDFGIMKWDFDEKRVKVSNTETNLKHDWWTKFLTADIEEDLKYVNIVEKELNLAFYTSFFHSLITKADKLSYGERNLKFKKILSDTDDDTTKEGLLLDTVLKKTNKDSILFITPDMEKWIQTDNVVNDELGDKGQIKYIGVWNERHVFVINVDKIRGLEKYTNEIIFVNKGNSYVLNPEKPIAYFNIIDNPFLERPIIKWFAGADFDISMDKASRMRVDNTFLE